MQKKHIICTFILILVNWVYIAAQDKPSDLMEVRYSKEDSIEGQKKLDWIKGLNKLNLNDTCLITKLSNNFFYKQSNYFEVSLEKQNLNKDSIILTSSFKNISPHNIYVCLGWWIPDSCSLAKTLDIHVLDMTYFGLDCFTFFKMESVPSQTTISKVFKVRKSEYEKVIYSISFIHDMESFVYSSRYWISFCRGIRPDKILVDGIIDHYVLGYKGLTNMYIVDFPLNNKKQKVGLLIKNNK